MKTYIGTKLIKAEPITRGEYNQYRGWELPSNEDGDEDGYLVEYLDGGKPNHPDHNGYISWSPEDVFRSAYSEVNGLISFGQALELLKAGGRVSRKDDTAFSFIVMMSGMTLPAYNDQSTQRKVNDRTAKWIGKDKPLVTTPYLAAMTVDGKWMPGWTPTQDDMFAKDWIPIKE